MTSAGVVRVLMDELFALLTKAQHPGGLSALTEDWNVTMKECYHDRCGALREGLEELQAVLATTAEESVPTATSQAIDDEEAGAPEGSAMEASPKDLLAPEADERASLAQGSPVTATVVGAREAMGGTRWKEEL
jgi:hypothetical protein